MENILIESLFVYFWFFLFIHKWNIHVKLFKSNFMEKLLGCSFCVGFWFGVALNYLGFAETLDIFIIPIIVLFIDLAFKRLRE